MEPTSARQAKDQQVQEISLRNRLGSPNPPSASAAAGENKLLKKLKLEEIRVKENISQIQATLAMNQKLFQQEKQQEHMFLKTQKRRENYDFQKSLGDGRPKHPSNGFLKANKEITHFEPLKLLIPPPELGREIRSQDEQLTQMRRTLLKSRVEADTEMPWQPTKSVPIYFDNLFQLKPVSEYEQVSSQLSSTTAAILKNRKLNSFYQLSASNGQQQHHKKLEIHPNSTRPATSVQLRHPSSSNNNRSQHIQSQQSHNRPNHIGSLILDSQRNNDKIRSSTILDKVPQIPTANIKPTSANNLIAFQQQLNSEKAAAASRNSFSSSSLNARGQQPSNRSNLGNPNNGIAFPINSNAHQKNQAREWINAYHEKQVFSQPRCDNLDIRLQGNNPHFRPFKPTKTKGYDFDKYISLEAAERDMRAAPKSLLDFDALDQETFDIAPKKNKH